MTLNPCIDSNPNIKRGVKIESRGKGRKRGKEGCKNEKKKGERERKKGKRVGENDIFTQMCFRHKVNPLKTALQKSPIDPVVFRFLSV